MPTHSTRPSLPVIVLALLLGIFAAHAQTVTQTITLQPGWNAVWLEVEPMSNASDLVFSNLPVASVWGRVEKVSSADYIQSPSEAAFNEAGWAHWYPPTSTESFLNNLFTVNANHAYLLRCTNASPVQWNIEGTPATRHLDWVPDAYNLRGLPVAPASPPTLVDFFRPSPAHYNAGTSQLESIYRLNSATGQWELAAPGELVQAGRAYWVFTRGGSDYLAPLDVRVELGEGLIFGSELSEVMLRVKNMGTAPVNAVLRDLAGASNSILSYYQFNTNLCAQWPVLPSVLPVTASPTQEVRVRLAVRRQDLIGDNYESVMEIVDGAGTRLQFPIRAQKPAPTGGIPLANELAGLWLGSASLNAVSETRAADPVTPTPTKSEMSLRLILHVDAGGQTRLLKQVIQMWRDGTYTNDVNGRQVLETPGRFVLLTDDTKIGQFQGASLRDGAPVGRRLSTVGYDFTSTPASNYVNVAGTFAPGQTLTVALVLPYDHPNNPFLHRYHPDHDNLNSRFDGPAMESFTVMRQVEMEIASSPPPGGSVADYGFNELGGAYRETFTGLHKNPIHVSGTFRLRRASYVAELNPGATP
jgi:hypothetical protein